MRKATTLIISSFAVLILLGTIVLSLPFSTTAGSIPLEDAFFTATSAVCVTGLIVVDTATVYTLFGKSAILLMFQLGGLGIMTFSALVLIFLGRRISVLQRDVIHSTQGPQNIGIDLRQVARPVLLYVLLAEGVGTLVLWLSFLRYYPWDKALFHALFHAVSAFCNAGFSSFSDSLMPYSGDWLISLPVTMMIILGGLGFVVLLDVYETVRFNKPIYLHTKLVFSATLVLLIIGALSFLLLEGGNALDGKPLHEQLLMSIFHSATTRTAGFNTVDYASLTHGTLVITWILMMIGGSPGSTAGGIKTTTVAIVWLTAIARIKGKSDPEFGKRSIAKESVTDAITLMFLSSIFVLFVVLVLQVTELGSVSHSEAGGSLMKLMFEAISAFGTVGLSMGATPDLSFLGKMMIALTMFIGRLGPLTFFYLMGKRGRKQEYRLHAESVMVG
jgi:trk system potassium uptake protein TrkH